MSPRTQSRCGNPRKCRPCCPANFFLRLANGSPSPPPPDAPACVLRLTGHGLRCLQRFHEKQGLHSMTFQSQEGCCLLNYCVCIVCGLQIHIFVSCKSKRQQLRVLRVKAGDFKQLPHMFFRPFPAGRGISDAPGHVATRAPNR